MIKKILEKIYKTLTYRDFCPFCQVKTCFQPYIRDCVPHPVVVKHIVCPFCSSFHRHRFLYAVYHKYFLSSREKISVLHTAPEECLTKLMLKHENIAYTAVDLCPENFPFVECVRADVTDLPFPDESFDVIISNHVMEHIPDEAKFLRELRRVLKPHGRIFLTFPYEPHREKTFEDPSVQTDEERLRLFGQRDHVRVYGRDAGERLEKFFQVTYIGPKDLKMVHQQRWGDSDCFLLTKKPE